MRLEDLQCREVVEVLTDYLEGALAIDERVALEQHLHFCEGCADYVRQFRTSIGLTGRLQEEDVPPQVMDRIVGMLKER